jgi:hypothetical protein
MSGSIYTTLSAALGGTTTLRLTQATFGAGGISDVLATYFPPDNTLVIDNVHLAQQGEEVTFTAATGVSAPLTGLSITALFAPGAQDTVTMTLTATPPPGWRFSAGWPLLAAGPADQLTVTAGTLTLSSVAVPLGAPKGMSFAGTLGLPAGWGVLGWLLGQGGTLPASGPIGQRGTVPEFEFEAKLGDVDVPMLGPLNVAFVFGCTAVSGAIQLPGRLALTIGTLPAVGDPFPVYPFLPSVKLGVSARISVGQSTVPVFTDLTFLPGAVPVVADVSQLATVTLSDIAAVLRHDIAAVLPPKADFDPGQILAPRALFFTLDPSGPAMLSAGCMLGTIKSWPITDGFSAGPVSLMFYVDIGTGTVFASLTGDVNFPGGTLRLGAACPEFLFTGGLTDGSTISLSALIRPLLAGTPVPDLTLEQFDCAILPLKGGSFWLSTLLTGDWGVQVGPARLALTRAWLRLERQAGGNAAARTSGTIGAQATITPPGAAGAPITFDGSWTLPGTFSLTGKAPLLHLTELARYSGVPVPDRVPEVDLTDAALAIVLDNAGDYTFAVTAHAAVGGTDLGAAAFAVRRTPTAFGFLAGIVIAAGWSPAQIWPELRDVFGDLTISRSGVLISTLPAGSPVNLPALQALPSLPGSTTPGFTFFSTLALEGPALGWLAGLFSGPTTLDLLAVVDTTTPARSSLTAALRTSAANNQVTWTELAVSVQPASTTFSITAAACLQFQGGQPPLTLAGTGSITLSPPAATLTLQVNNWVHPFGIENLVVETFALQVGWKEGAEIIIGLLGSFIIGTKPRAFLLKLGAELIDFEAPGALIFELASPDPHTPLLLSDVIMQFTSLDLSSVPILKDIAFGYLRFALVDDPAGFIIGGYTYPPGIGIAADILLWDWEATFSIEVHASTGIKASGQINKPITLGTVFALSDTTGKTGPSGLIDTSKLPARTERTALAELRDRRSLRGGGGGPDPYFILNGRLKFLGLDQAIKAQAAGQTFDFELDFAFLSTVTAHLDCHLIDATNFSAAAAIGFDLDVTVGPYSIGGLPLIPEVHIQAPSAALALGIKVNREVTAALTLGLKFAWQGSEYVVGFALSVAEIASDLTKLWDSIKTWLKDNAQRIFSEALGNATIWIELLLGPFAALALNIDAVANALATFFKTTAQDAAALLSRLGYEFMAIVNALVQFFQMAFDDALHLVESLISDCAMQNAEEAAYQAPSAAAPYTLTDVAFALTASPAGQHLLEIYYCHQAEITRLLAGHPYLHDQLRSLVTSPQRARDTRFIADTALSALFAIMPDASPELSAHADELIEALTRYRDMTVPAVLAELGAQR